MNKNGEYGSAEFFLHKYGDIKAERMMDSGELVRVPISSEAVVREMTTSERQNWFRAYGGVVRA